MCEIFPNSFRIWSVFIRHLVFNDVRPDFHPVFQSFILISAIFFIQYVHRAKQSFHPNTLSTVISVTKLRMFPRCVIAWLNLNGSFQKGQLAPQPLSMQLVYLCSSNRRRKKQLSICLTNSSCVAQRLF